VLIACADCWISFLRICDPTALFASVHGGRCSGLLAFVIDLAAYGTGSAMLGHLQMDSVNLAGGFCAAERTEDVAVTEPSVGVHKIVGERVEVRTVDGFHYSLG
jgi:hypothetical protein